MNNQYELGQAIGFTSIISIIFMICYVFELTNTPVFLLLVSVMSFGYTLCLLSFHDKKTKLAKFLYFTIGSLLILLCVALSFTTPHESMFYN